MQHHRVFPVIHHLDAPTSKVMATIAAYSGADGVFLISHDGRDDELVPLAAEIREKHGGLRVGLNFLGSDAVQALLAVIELPFVDMLWTDAPGVSSSGPTIAGRQIEQLMLKMSTVSGRAAPLQFFGSVAFKYQPHEADPAGAASAAVALGMIPTTSGSATGSAPVPEKLASMRAALHPDDRLAVASGMTPENVGDFLPHVTDFLVATGVSHDMHHLDIKRLTRFVETVRRGGAAS